MAKIKKSPVKKLPIDDQLTVIGFLGDILTGARENAISIDHQVNILIGFSTAIFVFAIGELRHNVYEVIFLILATMAAASAIIGLLAVHPPRFSVKRGQKESLLYNREIVTFRNSDIYAERLFKTMENRDEVVRQYSTEIYNLYRYYYRPKRRLFHMARNTLLAGIILAFATFIIILGNGHQIHITI